MGFDQKKIEGYLAILKKHLLPNLHFKSMWDEGRQFRLPDTFDVCKGSKYFYSGSHLFLHFTTIPNLLNILREKKIRLYSLSGMDDKDEYSGSLTNMGIKEDEWKGKQIKKNIFIFSMCEYKIEQEEKSLNLWREYGSDGNDIAIVFKIKPQLKKHWVHYMLSQVYYSKKALNPFLKAAEEIKEYEVRENFKETDFKTAFYKLFAFHKQEIYKHEREVRLLYSTGLTERDREKAIIDFRNKKKTLFVERELEWKQDKDMLTNERILKLYNNKQEYLKMARNVFPHISIHKILFGYRLSKEVKEELRDAIYEIIKNKKYKTVPKLEDSSLFKYFNEIDF
ncbi:MAG: DUF2971 domain-containing protein [Bacteroidota bacterium]